MLHRVHTGEKVVACTFDDGPHPAHTREVLDLLAGHSAMATFFITGQEGSDFPGELQAVVAAGYQVDNHTWSHPRLIFMSAALVTRKFESTDRIIRLAGFHDPILVRTPFGKRSLTAPLYLAGNRRLNVFWDCEPESNRALEGHAEKPAADVAALVRQDSIVLLQLMYPSRGASREALSLILQALEKQHSDSPPSMSW